jgi:hypothetical protein
VEPESMERNMPLIVPTRRVVPLSTIVRTDLVVSPESDLSHVAPLSVDLNMPLPSRPAKIFPSLDQSMNRCRTVPTSVKTMMCHRQSSAGYSVPPKR